MTFSGRRPSVKDYLPWKANFSGRGPSVEDDLLWKTTVGGRQPLVEDDVGWKTNFGGGWPSVEDDLWWKTPFGGRHPSVEDDLWWILACCLVLFGAFCKDIYLSKYLMALYLKLMNTRWPPWNLEACYGQRVKIVRIAILFQAFRKYITPLRYVTCRDPCLHKNKHKICA